MNLLAQVAATTSGDTRDLTAATILVSVFYAFYLLSIIGLWKTIDKTGAPGVWALLLFVCGPLAMIPILRAVGRPWWGVILLVLPIVNIVYLIIVWFDLAKSFDKGVGFTLGLVFLPPIFLAILGFGSAQYRGPVVR